MGLAKEQERICRELGDPEQLVFCMKNQARILAAGLNRVPEGVACLEEARRIAADSGLTASVAQIDVQLTKLRG